MPFLYSFFFFLCGVGVVEVCDRDLSLRESCACMCGLGVFPSGSIYVLPALSWEPDLLKPCSGDWGLTPRGLFQGRNSCFCQFFFFFEVATP